jgi:hypothetical protein
MSKEKQATSIVKIEKDAPIEKFREIGVRIQKGEAKWVAYCIDGDKGYHHYLILS